MGLIYMKLWPVAEQELRALLGSKTKRMVTYSDHSVHYAILDSADLRGSKVQDSCELCASLAIHPITFNMTSNVDLTSGHDPRSVVTSVLNQ